MNDLINQALSAMKKSYSPYSNFSVGAALKTKNGKVFLGCNIENSSFPVTICAERVALFKAISEGESEFDSIAVVGGSKGEIKDYCTPCGVCRQALFEFCDRDFTIILYNGDDEKSFKLTELLPNGFSNNNLK